MPTVTGGKIGGSNVSDTANERHYNAQDIMPREMINRLDELGFIGRKLEESNLGRLVLLKGTLGVVDVGMIKEMLEPALNFHVREQTEKLKKVPKSAEKTELLNKLKELDAMKIDLVQFVKSVPFAIQGRFLAPTDNKGEDGVALVDEVWMTLNRDELIAPTNDINFKHGQFISGEWYLLGVLDALPYDDFNYTPSILLEIDEVINTMVNELREFVGRPKSSFGITPIAIFRNIEPHRN